MQLALEPMRGTRGEQPPGKQDVPRAPLEPAESTIQGEAAISTEVHTALTSPLPESREFLV